MTPPDPAPPSPLEALLAEVDRAVTDPRSFREDAFDWSAAARSSLSDAAPRLAAIVRVLREAAEMAHRDIGGVIQHPAIALGIESILRHALRRADEIAEGK